MQLHRVVSRFEMCVSSTGVIFLCLLLADGFPGNGMVLYGVFNVNFFFFLNANQSFISVSEDKRPEIIGSDSVQIKAQPGLCIFKSITLP